MRRAALGAVALVLLSGCIPTRALPPQPSGEELDELIAIELDYQWQYVGMAPDAERPEVERIRVVSGAEAEAVHRQCMIDAGFPSYSSGTGAVFGVSNPERIALYTCSAQYPLPPSDLNLFSDEQLHYLYDHYRALVIPCLRAAGVEVEDVPSRESYVERARDQLFAWSPYAGLSGARLEGYMSTERCPSYPDGFLSR